MLFDAQATSTSSSDLFTDLHCAEEDDAAFFVMPCVEGNPITMWRSDTNTHTHTHTHTCTHTLFRNDEKGQVVLFFFLSLFSFFPYAYDRVSLVSLAIHLVFSSCGTQAQTHHGTINKQSQQSRLHVCPCTETCVPVTGVQ